MQKLYAYIVLATYTMRSFSQPQLMHSTASHTY